MNINYLRELKRKNYAIYIFIMIIASLLTIYLILFFFFRNSNDYLERRIGRTLKRRNAFKPGEIEKIMKNIKIMRNLRVTNNKDKKGLNFMD